MNSDIMVAVTGASGFLAGNVISLLLKEGYKVKASIRRGAKCLLNSNENLELLEGDLNDPQFLDILCNNCKYVVHAAALTDQGVADYGKYYRINVETSLALLKSSERNKVKRFIFISTANTIKAGQSGLNFAELNDYEAPFNRSSYAKSKYEAEKALKLYADETELIILNPSFMIGGMDPGKSSGKFISGILNSSLVFIPSGGKNFVFVEDVARAVIQSFEYGKNKERYLITAHNINFKEFSDYISEKLHKNQIIIVLPRFLLSLAGLLGDALRYFGINCSFTSVNVSILYMENYFDNSRSRIELNMNYTSFDEMISKTLGWHGFKTN